jgi:hypothetical protein
MHWLYLVIAIALLAVAMKASGWLVVLLVLASLVAFIAWMLGWVSSRISSGARNDTQILSADELRRLREQAEARRAAGASPANTPPPPDEPPSA